MPRKKVNFIKTGKEIKDGKFKGLKKVKKSKTMSEKRAKKKQAKGQGFIEPRAYGSSPAEMSPYKMESAKQEKYNLLHDNPVAKHGSWMSKHSNSAMMMKGPMKMGHSPAEMGHDSPAKNHTPGHSIKRSADGTASVNEDSSMINKFRGSVPAPKGVHYDIYKDGKNTGRTGFQKGDILDADGDGDTIFNDSNDDGTMLSRGLKSLFSK